MEHLKQIKKTLVFADEDFPLACHHYRIDADYIMKSNRIFFWELDDHNLSLLNEACQDENWYEYGGEVMWGRLPEKNHVLSYPLALMTIHGKDVFMPVLDLERLRWVKEDDEEDDGEQGELIEPVYSDIFEYIGEEFGLSMWRNLCPFIQHLAERKGTDVVSLIKEFALWQ